ncbi:MAG: hypothetical protein QOH97_5320 [Actinoplanes sp.]|jgi:hypothetical protein|nr:hypothetical protein [Actinoplanes sp.]
MAAAATTRPSRVRAAIAALVTVIILAPAGVMVAWLWNDNQDQRTSTTLEQQGVEYLANLSPLISGLVEAQSSALQGVAAAPAALTAAVGRVSTVDQRLGDALATHERWSGLRDKIQRLPAVTGSTTDIFQAHVEVTNLALALYNSVRKNAELIRDADNDLSNLQQALAVDLPSAVVAVSRMGDLAQLVAGVTGTAAQRQQTLAVLVPQFGAAVQQVNTDVFNLTDNLQSAVDNTHSGTLSGNLVSSVDSFRRGVEAFTRGADPTGGRPNAGTMATAQSQLQTSLNGLAGVLIREMNGLLTDRLDRLDTRRLQLLISAGALVLLVLLSLVLQLTGRRRAGTAEHTSRGSAERPDGYSTGPLDPMPTYGDTTATRRERSGALR